MAKIKAKTKIAIYRPDLFSSGRHFEAVREVCQAAALLWP